MHDHVNDQIEDYLTGSLDGRAMKVLHRHIDQCRSCAKALREAREAQCYLKMLRPAEAAPVPGPDFYFKVQRAIQQKSGTDWLNGMTAMFQRPRFVYPLLFLFLGLLVTAWSISSPSDWGAAGILGIPPARFSGSIVSEADRMHSRDMVMVSLVDEN